MSTPEDTSIRVWDLPTRLFHWLFAFCVIAALVTVKAGDGMWMDWHIRFGIATLGLLVFRIIWGLTGPRYARFGTFVKPAGAIVDYIRNGHARGEPGHNPLGALSVIAMLAVIGIQTITGLFTTDDILYQGPFYNDVSSSTAAFMRSIHKLNEYVIFGLIGLHLAAILVYTLKGKRLVTPMITGNAPASLYLQGSPSSRDDVGIRAWALMLAVGLASVVWWLIQRAESGGLSF